MSVLESIARPLSPDTLRGHWPKFNKLRWLTAFKASLAAVIAIGIAMGLGWQRPYWAGISVLVATLPYIGASLEKGIMRIIGTLVAAGPPRTSSAAFSRRTSLATAAMLFGMLVIRWLYGHGQVLPVHVFSLCGITISIINAEVFNDLDQLWPVVFFRVSEISLGVDRRAHRQLPALAPEREPGNGPPNGRQHSRTASRSL